MSLKELKKLAALCRAAGITHLKTAEVELTLSDSPPAPRSKRTAAQKATVDEASSQIMADIVNEDTLTQEQLLFFSVADVPEGNS